jgi:hypothetical protein
VFNWEGGKDLNDTDRSKPLRLKVSKSSEEDEELASLAAKGKLKLGEGVIDDSFWDLPAPRISPATLRRALQIESDEN